jgi:hypothetical protein
MKNKSVDLHNILFEQLERLNDEGLEGAKLQEEIKRAEAMNKTAAQIINNGNLVLNAMRLADEIGAGEMFRHSSKTRRELEAPRDYKAEVFKLLQNHRKNFVMESSLENAKHIIKLLIKYGTMIDGKVYKQIYDCLIAGDPKQRTLRGIITNINVQYAHRYNKNRKKI